MAKSLVIDPTHHAVQLAQKTEFICVICQKCSCCTADRMEQECRTLEWYTRNHIAAPTRPGPADFE